MPNVPALFAHYVPFVLAFFALLIKVGVPLGLFGSALERLGLSLSPKFPRVGAAFERAGRVIEAICGDLPKFVSNALAIMKAFGRAIGVTVGLLLLLYFSQACTKQQALSEAQLGAVTTGCKAGQAIDDDAGASGARDDLDRGCRETIHVWMRGGDK